MTTYFEATPLGQWAFKAAEAAANWLSQESGGKLLSWQDMSYADRMTLATAAVAQLALTREIAKDPWKPEEEPS